MKKVLFIRFSSIGDIVLTTPVVRCVKKALENTEIHYLTKAQYRPLLEANPNVDRIICIGNESDLGSIIKVLEEEKYDFIVDLHRNFRSWGVIISLKRPFGTFSKLNIGKFILCRFKIDLLPKIHIVDRYFQAVRRLGINNDGRGLDYFLPPGINPRIKIPDLPAEGYLVLAIGGKHATKQLPWEKLLELCVLLEKPVVLLGGKEDEATADYLIRNSQVSTAVFPLYNTCGKLSLHESAALIRDADQVITHDTGMMHIAAAFRKDIISIWGNTIPGFGMYPYFPADYEGESTIVEVKGLRCRPCSKLGYRRCPRGHFRCMMDIDLQAVVDPVRV